MAREKEIYPVKSALLLVDVQNSEITPTKVQQLPYYSERIQSTVLPNIERLIGVCRERGVEVLYTVIEALTRDGRDRSLDHKLSDMLIPAGSPLGKVIDCVKPLDDEMTFKKTSSGVFNSTNVDYVLRNLGIENLFVVGLLTDQCVDMAVRDGADRGYFVICVEDACATHSQERHDNALAAFGGYCLIQKTDELIAKILPTDLDEQPQ